MIKEISLTDVEKAAIMLISIGEEKAAEILKYLGPKEVQIIGHAMSSLDNIPQSLVEDVIDDFIESAADQTSIGIDNDSYIKNMLGSALGVEKAKTLIDRILITANTSGLDTLRWMEPRQVAELLRFEHPQIMTVIMSYLDAEQAAAIISYFDEMIRLDLIRRIAALDSVQPQALQELNDMLESQFTGNRNSQDTHLGGVKHAASIMNFFDSRIENEIMEEIRAHDEFLADTISDLMFVFDNFVDMEDRSLQTVLRDVPQDVLMKALKGADEDVKEKVLGNISERAAAIMRDDMEAMGPIRIAEVENAQKEIINMAKKLADQGKIMLGSGNEDMM